MITWRVVLAVVFLTASTARAANDDAWSDSYRQEVSGQLQAAIDALAPILKKFPRHEFAHLRKGWLHYLSGQHNDSVAEYKIAAGINAKSLDARLGATLPLLAQQRWREAAYFARQVIELDPWNYYAHVRLMICEEAEGQWEALAKHAGELTARYPSDATAQVYLARAYVQLGRDSQARVIYEQVLERIPRHIEATKFLSQVER
jgi:tetratricopeptide (TPR) repeat protein